MGSARPTLLARAASTVSIPVGPMEKSDFDDLYEVALAADGSVVRVDETIEF